MIGMGELDSNYNIFVHGRLTQREFHLSLVVLEGHVDVVAGRSQARNPTKHLELKQEGQLIGEFVGTTGSGRRSKYVGIERITRPGGR